MTSPGSRNEFAKKAKKMKYPAQMDNVDYGKKTKIVARNIDHVDTKTGQYYGTRTIMTKENAPSFKDFLLSESKNDDITTVPEKVLGEIKGLIRKGAADLTQAWANALELTNTAYHVARVRLPRPEQKGGWKQYMDMISFSVKQLAQSRGLDGKWRVAGSTVREAVEQNFDDAEPIGKHRIFVSVPGEDVIELHVDNLDDAIDMIVSRIRVGKEVRGTKVRVEERSKERAVLAVYVNDVLRDRIELKDVS